MFINEKLIMAISDTNIDSTLSKLDLYNKSQTKEIIDKILQKISSEIHESISIEIGKIKSEILNNLPHEENHKYLAQIDSVLQIVQNEYKKSDIDEIFNELSNDLIKSLTFNEKNPENDVLDSLLSFYLKLEEKKLSILQKLSSS